MDHILRVNHLDNIIIQIAQSATFTITVEAAQPTQSTAPAWVLPVDPAYPWTTMRGNRHNPVVHSGYDINVNQAPWGNVEAQMGLSVYAITAGIVHYASGVEPGWGAGGIVVLQVDDAPFDLFVRYAHITPLSIQQGDVVQAGQVIGAFVPHPKGSHLHFDMCRNHISSHWLTAGLDWVDPAVIMEQHMGNVAREFFST